MILNTAAEKLCCAQKFYSMDTTHTLAVLGQQFCLALKLVSREATDLPQMSVAEHPRICADATEDKTWLTTLYPSEPILACASSRLLHHNWKLFYYLISLRYRIASGLIDMDKRGELVSRLILLLAKDLCVRQPAFKSSRIIRTPW